MPLTHNVRQVGDILTDAVGTMVSGMILHGFNSEKKDKTKLRIRIVDAFAL